MAARRPVRSTNPHAASTFGPMDPTAKSPSRSADGVVRPMIENVHTNLMRELDSITIEDLCHKAEEKGLAEPLEVRADFAI